MKHGTYETYMAGCLDECCFIVALEVERNRRQMTSPNHGATVKTVWGRSPDSLRQRDLYQKNRRRAKGGA